MPVSDDEPIQAVIFFDNNKVVREMLYSEFEAILDGFVPFSKQVQAKAKAVFIRINPQLSITHAVFFTIGFDQNGFADKRWNIPLEQLADSAARGPDLGAGPVRLACHSQCPINWHKEELWDPVMTPGANNFVWLRKAIERNRLGLPYKEPEPPPEPAATEVLQPTQIVEPEALERHLTQKLHGEYEQKLRNRLAHTLKEQRLRILTMNSQHKTDLKVSQQEHQKRLEEYQDKVDQVKVLLADEQQRNLQLKQTIEGQTAKIEGLREYFEHKLKSAKSIENNQLQALKMNFDMELEAKIKAATADLKDMLQMREMELLYRNEQEGHLHQEIARLRQENQQLLNEGGDQLLEKISQNGVNFVAYHQGAGHMTIPLTEMSRYMENPVAFAADRCGVSEKQYNDWLAHYKSPRCRALNERGEFCDKTLNRVESPREFHAGESDRCETHRSQVEQPYAVVN